MNRKDFIILFYNKYLKVLLFLIITIIVVLNFTELVKVSKFLGSLLILMIIIFFLAGTFIFLLNEISQSIPIKIRSFFYSIRTYLEKFKFIFPILLISFLIYFWQNKTIAENLILSGIILFFSCDIYFKKKIIKFKMRTAIVYNW